MSHGYTPTVTSRGPECLDDDTVIGFLEGTLSGEARATVNAHVDRCPACLALVAAVGRSVPKPALEGSERYALRTEVGTGGCSRRSTPYWGERSR